MSINDFATLFARTAFGARPVLNKFMLPLAACIVSATAIDASAASYKFAKIATTQYLSPVSPVRIDESSASFKERFDFRQASLIRDILSSPSIRVPLTPLTTASLPRYQKIIPAGDAIIGIASMYNPTDPSDMDAGTEELASGERYDVNGWTAAIRTDLRKKFGGVRFGRNYQPTFALVQSDDKQLIVKINDVGPLRRGRIIDLNLRAMRYFDPTLQLGLIGNVKVTPLAGREWALGPVIEERPVNFASRFDQTSR